MKITDRARTYVQEVHIRARLAADFTGEVEPAGEGHRPLWDLALRLGIVDAAEHAAARKALDWQWGYAGS